MPGEIKGFLTLLDLGIWIFQRGESQTLHLEEGRDISRCLKCLKLHSCRKCELVGGFSTSTLREVVCNLDIGSLLTAKFQTRSPINYI